MNLLQRNCKKCKVLKREKKSSDYCHCSLWSPPEELMVTMRDGGPWKCYQKDMEDRAKEEKDKEVLKELRREEDKPQMMLDLQKEARKMKTDVKTRKKQMLKKRKSKSNKVEIRTKIHRYGHDQELYLNY